MIFSFDEGLPQPDAKNRQVNPVRKNLRTYRPYTLIGAKLIPYFERLIASLEFVHERSAVRGKALEQNGTEMSRFASSFV
jgi:hypothetical protein